MEGQYPVPGNGEISYLSRRPDGRREGAESHGRKRMSLIFKVVDRLDVIFGLRRCIERGSTAKPQ